MVFVSVRPLSVASDRKQPELAHDKRECIHITGKPREKADCDVIYDRRSTDFPWAWFLYLLSL